LTRTPRARAARGVRRLAAVELPLSAVLYLAARLAASNIAEPSSPLYVLLVTLIMLLATLSFALNMLAVIVSMERLATLALAAATILVATGASAAAAATFTVSTAPAKAASLAVALAAIALLAYNSVKAVELLAERPETTRRPTVQRPW
jgi:hypothetical protein